MSERTRIHAATRAALAHLGISALVALPVAAVVLGLWFPSPFRELAGGLPLFWILIAVHVVCGPLLTALVFNPRKSRRELTLDLSVIGLLQTAALVYGLYSIALARPVALVFESDRMVVATAASLAPGERQALSWTGPQTLGTRAPRDNQEMLHSIEMSLQGREPSLRPDWWQAYALSVPEVLQKMQPLPGLRHRLTAEGQRTLDHAAHRTGLATDQLHYLPLVAGTHLDGWIALLDGQARIMGYAPVGGFN